MIEIVNPEGEHDLTAARELMRAFVEWHRERHQDDWKLTERHFASAAFEEELAGLPGPYAQPRGRLLLARCHGAQAGTAGIGGIRVLSIKC